MGRAASRLRSWASSRELESSDLAKSPNRLPAANDIDPRKHQVYEKLHGPGEFALRRIAVVTTDSLPVRDFRAPGGRKLVETYNGRVEPIEANMPPSVRLPRNLWDLFE